MPNAVAKTSDRRASDVAAVGQGIEQAPGLGVGGGGDREREVFEQAFARRCPSEAMICVSPICRLACMILSPAMVLPGGGGSGFPGSASAW